MNMLNKMTRNGRLHKYPEFNPTHRPCTCRLLWTYPIRLVISKLMDQCAVVCDYSTLPLAWRRMVVASYLQWARQELPSQLRARHLAVLRVVCLVIPLQRWYPSMGTLCITGVNAVEVIMGECFDQGQTFVATCTPKHSLRTHWKQSLLNL